MKKLALLLAVILPVFLTAQNRQIKGKVTDESNAPMVGVNVLIKGFGAPAGKGC